MDGLTSKVSPSTILFTKSGGSESWAEQSKAQSYTLAQTHWSLLFTWGNRGPGWFMEASYKSQDLGLPPLPLAYRQPKPTFPAAPTVPWKDPRRRRPWPCPRHGLHHSSSQNESFQAWLTHPTHQNTLYQVERRRDGRGWAGGPSACLRLTCSLPRPGRAAQPPGTPPRGSESACCHAHRTQ